MARAFDNGVEACIILTKGTNALVDQTVKRMKYDFRECKRDALPKIFPTVSIYDIMKKRVPLRKSLINGEKNVYIAKKQDENMQILLDVFLNSELREKNILIIDDEADFVSRAFMKKKSDVKEGVIASQIDKLIEGLPNCRYLQVTATPYSLYLQPDNYVDVSNGRVVPFRPRFTALVPIHDKYVGSKQYFVESQDDQSMYSSLYHEVAPDCIACLTTDKKVHGHFIKRGILVKNVENSPKIKDLRWSVMHYFVASAIREIQEENLGHDSYHTSYVMHVGTDKLDHAWEADLIETLLNSWADSLATPGANVQGFNELFDEIYGNLEGSISLGRLHAPASSDEDILAIPDKDVVYTRVVELIQNEEYNVQLVNSDQNVQSLLDDNGQLELTHKLNLFIGAFVLDRGITINHLLGFFYGREPQTKQQATVLQHCRMYGNRSLNDMAVTRLYSQRTLYNVLKKVNEMDDMMRERFAATINNPKADPSIEFVICDKSNGIIPCNMNSVALSKGVVWKAGKFVLPSGQQTINSVARLRELVRQIGLYFAGKTERVCFEIDAKDAIAMVNLAKEQFVYSSKYENKDCEWDGLDMITLIDRLKDSNGKILVYTRTGCNTSRVRSDGNGFIDAPLDGQVESPYIKSLAIEKPVLAMQLNKGEKKQGWLGEPFYWPVLCLPQSMDSIMYCPR
ncbi:Z1 domain-containing protein [uncultured Fibrobacter sp.]|uniref:Z1 domain-containing protein n=1 Tax=uncultured Fibrobacter sp. TaxID=261512 RepID=UPI0025F8734D|nr:Z1 domain-containing protein [uncultured Fibrobacter sp.]